MQLHISTPENRINLHFLRQNDQSHLHTSTLETMKNQHLLRENEQNHLHTSSPEKEEKESQASRRAPEKPRRSRQKPGAREGRGIGATLDRAPCLRLVVVIVVPFVSSSLFPNGGPPVASRGLPWIPVACRSPSWPPVASRGLL